MAYFRIHCRTPRSRRKCPHPAQIGGCCAMFECRGMSYSVEKLIVLTVVNGSLTFVSQGLCHAARGTCGAGMSFASFRRFWAVAARWNSSRAPHGPRNRSLPKPRMRLRWANSISTFFRSLHEIAYCLILAMSRATWRASSCSSRVILRASALGQHLGFEGQAWQVSFRA